MDELRVSGLKRRWYYEGGLEIGVWSFTEVVMWSSHLYKIQLATRFRW